MKRHITIAVFAYALPLLGIALVAPAAQGGGELLVPQQFSTIQNAIDAAAAEGGDQIVVAPGTYAEAIDFGGKAVHLRSAAGRDVTTIDATGLMSSAVTFASGDGQNSIIDGFTITGGTGSMWEGSPRGGGALIVNASPAIIDCAFEQNSALEGGGAYVTGGSPTLTNCNFTNNTTTDMGGGMGSRNAQPTLVGCTFTGNSSGSGGGLHVWEWNVTLTDCAFDANNASVGGAITSSLALLWITDCTFENNTSVQVGGVRLGNGVAHIERCTFANNTAEQFGGALGITDNYTTVIDSIFDSNTAGSTGGAAYSSFESTLVLLDCEFRGNVAEWGGGAVYVEDAVTDVYDSLFCANTPEHIAWFWNDGGGNEFLEECPPLTVPCPADVNGSGAVDVFDLLDLLSAWGPCAECAADLDENGAVDVFDLLDLLSAWGPCP